MKCVHCGGEVLWEPGSSIGICASCMAENPLPKEGARGERYEKATAALRENRFDEAFALYRELLIENPMDGAVCWGMALSEYGIEYVDDPATGEQLPTLHRLSLQKFSEYLYVKKAIDLSWNSLDREFYIRQSKIVDGIQIRSLSVSEKEVPVDVFICYKRSAEGEKRTADSRMAADYYRELTRRGYQVFFAEETLKAGEEYEPRIFAALQSARVMIAVASKKEYYEAVWVRNEWSRYADLIEREKKEKGESTRLLIPLYQHITHGELPEILQAQPSYVEMSSSSNPKAELFSLVVAHFERGEAEDVSSILRQVRQSSSSLHQEGMTLKEDGSGRFGTSGKDFQESAEKTRILATVRLAGREFEKAKELFLQALSQEGGDRDPEIYLGLMMCDRLIPGREALASYTRDIDGNDNFQKALACASPEKQEELRKIAQNCLENQKWQRENQYQVEECRRQVQKFLKSVSEGSAKELGNLRAIETHLLRCELFLSQPEEKGVMGLLGQSRRKKKLAEELAWIGKWQRGLKGEGERCKDELRSELSEIAEPGRRFNTRYEEELARWNKKLDTAVEERVRMLRARLDACERGMF